MNNLNLKQSQVGEITLLCFDIISLANVFNLDECYLRNETDKIDIFPFQTNVFHLPDFKCVLCEYCQVNYENKYQLLER